MVDVEGKKCLRECGGGDLLNLIPCRGRTELVSICDFGEDGDDKLLAWAFHNPHRSLDVAFCLTKALAAALDFFIKLQPSSHHVVQFGYSINEPWEKCEVWLSMKLRIYTWYN